MKLEKLTELHKVPQKRQYRDACGLALALDLIGERWAMLVIRELIFGPKRFNELRAGLPGISANVLTQRLEGLEAAAVVRRHRLPPPASAQVYELTEWGYECEPVIRMIGRWAIRSPEHDSSLPVSTTSIMLSFKTMFDPARAMGLSLSVGFRFGAESFTLGIADGAIAVSRGDATAPDLHFTGTPEAVAALVYGGEPLEALEAEGMLAVEGDRALVARFATLFPMPEKHA